MPVGSGVGCEQVPVIGCVERGQMPVGSGVGSEQVPVVGCAERGQAPVGSAAGCEQMAVVGGARCGQVPVAGSAGHGSSGSLAVDDESVPAAVEKQRDGVAYVLEDEILAVGIVDLTRSVLHDHKIERGFI